jgi:hypothetical protein
LTACSCRCCMLWIGVEVSDGSEERGMGFRRVGVSSCQSVQEDDKGVLSKLRGLC